MAGVLKWREEDCGSALGTALVWQMCQNFLYQLIVVREYSSSVLLQYAILFVIMGLDSCPLLNKLTHDNKKRSNAMRGGVEYVLKNQSYAALVPHLSLSLHAS